MNYRKKLYLFLILCCLFNCEKTFDPIVSQHADPPEPAEHTAPPSANLIFLRWVDEAFDIFFLDTSGYEQRLTFGGMNPPCYLEFPVFSPDGSEIAFSSRKTGEGDIYIMNADGSDLCNLTSHPAGDVAPQFSPDGSYLIFNSNRSGNWEIYSMNLDGSNPKNLTQCNFVDADPAFSPDGSRIVFTSNRDGDSEVYIMNADGQHQQNLTDFPGGAFTVVHDHLPEISLDGNKIMFISGRDIGESLYIIDSNGNNQKFLVRAGQSWGMYFDKVFSKDSKYIIYEQHTMPGVQRGIYRIDIERMDNRLLSGTSLYSPHDGAPALSPDGSKIAFHSNRDGNLELYEMNLDGTEQVRLTNNETSDRMLIFQPFER